MGKLYTTMQGKQLDMEKLALKNELTPAVGNVQVNARGDELGPGGQIIRKREDVLAEYYKQNNRAVKDDVITRTGRKETVKDQDVDELE
jgi:hypothetical protein